MAHQNAHQKQDLLISLLRFQVSDGRAALSQQSRERKAYLLLCLIAEGSILEICVLKTNLQWLKILDILSACLCVCT